MASQKGSSDNNAKVLKVIALVIILLFSISPLIWMLIVAFRVPDKIFEPIWMSPTGFTLDNIVGVLKSGFPKSILNSFTAALGASSIALIIGVPAAFSLAKWKIRGKNYYSWFVLLLRMAPPIGFAIPLFLFFVNFNMIDNIFGLIVAYLIITLPLVIWLMWMYFSDLPNELLESASIDGASLWRTFFSIALPLSKPGLVTAGILSFILAWNDFFFALILTRSKSSTGPVAIMDFLTYSSYNWSAIASASILLALPTIPIIFFMGKYIVSGIMGGSVKG
ncbi:carbohydrate ABC transporter permease [Sporosarcina sp. Marseille-Q4063]|uniref:carbohydrate ABC transporter permease n=1 Tax=Sporosarcina sp. Marseille-Q4063 TaxID=2810514 RepID=UPI001BAEED67|nr:carbohydrate ABC transporter permease [Sporosarcina sp. Marseille-Q4063]QUW21265.1 carbohydrate ABC transporter permease [Sporosarcina sp. Marseille-Q4063]